MIYTLSKVTNDVLVIVFYPYRIWLLSKMGHLD